MEDFKKELWNEVSGEFRRWNKEWNLFDQGDKTQKPPTVDDFLEELSKKYVLIRR